MGMGMVMVVVLVGVGQAARDELPSERREREHVRSEPWFLALDLLGREPGQRSHLNGFLQTRRRLLAPGKCPRFGLAQTKVRHLFFIFVFRNTQGGGKSIKGCFFILRWLFFFIFFFLMSVGKLWVCVFARKYPPGGYLT